MNANLVAVVAHPAYLLSVRDAHIKYRQKPSGVRIHNLRLAC